MRYDYQYAGAQYRYLVIQFYILDFGQFMAFFTMVWWHMLKCMRVCERLKRQRELTVYVKLCDADI